MIFMECFDIHTHCIVSSQKKAIASCSIGIEPLSEEADYVSVGIHPWHLTEENASRLLQLLEKELQDKRVLAIGEAGLDRLHGAPLDIQVSTFRNEIILAENYHFPVIIHCVKAFGELLHLKKELRPQQPWIIHGFRGKKSMALELLRHGCFLSFGANFHKDTVRSVPVDRLFIETDESKENIEDICRYIAEVKGVSPEELADAINKNVCKVFFKL